MPGGKVRHAVGAGAVVALVAALVAVVLAVHLAARARGAEGSRCERFAAQSAIRSQVVTGTGERVVVIGDSYAAGLGLAAPGDSWPARLPGEVHVAGFSGSGFSRGASGCPAVAFSERAAVAVRRGADLVVVEGGLNDHDQPEVDVRAGFARLLRELDGHRVVVVGPPAAPAREAGVPRIDRLLAALAARHAVPYVRTSGWELPYLEDGLHLTPAGHRLFGDAVARILTREVASSPVPGGSSAGVLAADLPPRTGRLAASGGVRTRG